MRIALRKIGNSVGVIIPKEFLDAWGVGKGDALEAGPQGIWPPRSRRVGHAALDELKRAISIEVLSRHSPAEIRKKSLANLDRWKAAAAWCSAYDEWREIMEHADDGRLYAVMIGMDAESNRLRQSVPYVGMLPRDVLENLREKAAG